MGEASRDSVPLLAKLVKRVFPVPATSSKFERVFSVAGNVVTPIRANLNPEKVEDLVVAGRRKNALNQERIWASEGPTF